ncbi:1-acylglycerol-3-phosphate O-acyltransferase [Chondrus crispus]|uniref:1-acylglycerol-3-phosphate O-acyltransferase n=1 Tax=Chondrus crispus TaxID=2769 RepID=R7QM75_CHOCR|nr:1-acylglycerol-3-phosphate O-acyltransferase [Chondrus crispus]CDF38878.1 1-acylglycerol-3-phosphate O-acyltransferase [Chondrus crispus]|eukprot:XP_005718783.1 1-acylglycerol-3-phosphate O-acyltransferase [Chondrus crispus]
MSAAFWARNVDDLVALGYRVIAVDLLGWGRSQRPAFRGKTADDVVEWYVPSLAGALQTMGLDKFVLVGHSLGAYLAMEYTKRNIARVTDLVLVSPAASTREVSLKRAVYFSLPPQAIVRRGGLMGFAFFFMVYPRSESYIADRLREYTYHLAAQGPASGEEAVRPIIRLRWGGKAECVRPLVEHLDRFDIPVRIIVGETDSSMPVESVHELYREMKRKGFRVQIDVVKGADHCPQIEKPEEFLQIVSELGAPLKMRMRDVEKG